MSRVRRAQFQDSQRILVKNGSGPVSSAKDILQDGELNDALLGALALAHSGVCLCDEQDNVRYANDTFRTAFFPDLPVTPINFVDALAAAISNGKGIKLETTSVDAFIQQTKERRRDGSARYDFTVDLVDGSWWFVNDLRLASGWILMMATEVSRIKQDERALRNAHASALKESQTDFLTGLSNRRFGLQQAAAALENFRGNRLPLTLAVIDLDHFKAINDTYGHKAGDEVLIEFANLLRRKLGPRDQVSRLGGEEFLVIMADTSSSRAATRIRTVLQGVPTIQRGVQTPTPLTFSAGVATAHYLDDAGAILARADEALYSAKRHGRNRVEVCRATRSRLQS